MEEETRGGPSWEDKKRKPKCTINIFCDEKKHHDMAWGKDDDDCVINIFCDEKKKHHGPDCDHKDDDSCTINIFCNDKKPEDKCDKEKW